MAGKPQAATNLMIKASGSAAAVCGAGTLWSLALRPG
jgi:hypothetical protein